MPALVVRRSGSEVRAGIEIKLDAESTNGELTAFELRMAAGARSARHLHTREQEVFLIIEGTLSLETDDGVTVLHAGDAAVLPREVRHAFGTDHGARFLILTTPGGLERFFRDIDSGVQPDAAAAATGLRFF
jgi:quercetin dioxygenase-like cupin family protein